MYVRKILEVFLEIVDLKFKLFGGLEIILLLNLL